MPSLPMPEDKPGMIDRAALGARRAASAVGADARVSIRALICLLVAGVSISLAPAPWAAIGMAALLILALDWARTKRGTG